MTDRASPSEARLHRSIALSRARQLLPFVEILERARAPAFQEFLELVR